MTDFTGCDKAFREWYESLPEEIEIRQLKSSAQLSFRACWQLRQGEIDDLNREVKELKEIRATFAERNAILFARDLERSEQLAAAQADLVRMREALILVRSIIIIGANNGFNPALDDWADKLFRSQAITFTAISTPPDRNALDAMLVAAKVEGMRMAAKEVENWGSLTFAELNELADQLAAGTPPGPDDYDLPWPDTTKRKEPQ